ncbi:MAG: hypothetical protein ACR2OA_00215 [Rubripirellula sp.]|jgi:hypothetical protein
MNKFTQGFAIFSLVALTLPFLCGCDGWIAKAGSTNIEPLGFIGTPQIPDGSDPAECPICCDEGPNAVGLDAPQSE